MRKLKNKIGMTMAEVLIVVAIVAVLGGVAAVAVWNYQRSLGQLERDGIAKEIFVAAQNHLTAAYGEGYLDAENFGLPGTADGDADGQVYYYVVNSGSVVGNGDDIFELMLPFGSVDETVRRGGSYLIRYQKSTGLVIDVFYCTLSGFPARFNHRLAVDEYGEALAVTGERNKPARRNYRYGNDSILGWYGGTGAASLPSTILQAPTLQVVNAETLYATVTNPNSANPNAKLKLIITGVQSKAKKAYEITGAEYTLVLDDITAAGNHFADIQADTGVFIPGEDIKIQAVAYSNSALANIAYSEEKTTNSLFESINDARDTAYIKYMRHLENLDKEISDLDAHDTNLLDIKHAVQTDDLSWTDFKAATDGDSTVVYSRNSIALTSAGSYCPISPDYTLTYDGQSNSISDVVVNTAGHGGLFGRTTSVTDINNLELIDFSISGSSSAGALAGTLGLANVSNVLARNSTEAAAVNVDSDAGDAGGLIGVAATCVIENSAAALIVHGGHTAGGLIGTASGSVTGCYAGGHTIDITEGDVTRVGYSSSDYNVTGTTAGGLIGDSSATIRSCYSTCSVSGTTAGGFVGSAEGSIRDTYCTGLVSTDTAYIGSGTPSFSGSNHYYETVNEVLTRNAGGDVTSITYKAPGSASVTALDADTASFNAFTGSSAGWAAAKPYDETLVSYFAGKYDLQTVQRLGASPITDGNTDFTATHYGDWPAPELWFYNTPASLTP